MSNSLGVLTPIIRGELLNSVPNQLAMLSDFTFKASSNAVSRENAVIQVPFLSAGSVTVLNPTTYANSDSSGAKITVAMDEVVTRFGITNAEYQNGYQITDLFVENIKAHAAKIQDLVFAKFTTANFGAPIAALSSLPVGGFGLTQVEALFGALKGGSKVCYTNSAEYGKFTTNLNYQIDPLVGMKFKGFDKFGYTDLFNAGSKVCAIGTSGKGALVIGSAIPQIPAQLSSVIDEEIIDLGNGLKAALRIWADPNTMSVYGIITNYFGVSVGDPTAAKLVTNV